MATLSGSRVQHHAHAIVEQWLVRGRDVLQASARGACSASLDLGRGADLGWHRRCERLWWRWRLVNVRRHVESGAGEGDLVVELAPPQRRQVKRETLQLQHQQLWQLGEPHPFEGGHFLLADIAAPVVEGFPLGELAQRLLHGAGAAHVERDVAEGLVARRAVPALEAAQRGRHRSLEES